MLPGMLPAAAGILFGLHSDAMLHQNVRDYLEIPEEESIKVRETRPWTMRCGKRNHHVPDV